MKSKRETRAKAASDGELMRLVRYEIEPKSEELEEKARRLRGLRPKPLKLQKLLAALDAYQRKKAAGLDWRRIAKLAANGLEDYRYEIELAAATGQKQFFIDLGKCLLGDIKRGYDKLDSAIVDILSHNQSIKASAAVRELKKRGHPQITEENFRMRKQRLKALARALHKREEAREAQLDEYLKDTMAAHRERKT